MSDAFEELEIDAVIHFLAKLGVRLGVMMAVLSTVQLYTDRPLIER